MRDLLVLSIVFGSIPFCLARPHIGIFLWVWISYMNPHRLTWGIAYNFPVAQLIALVVLVGFIFDFFKGKVSLYVFKERETILLLFLWVMFTFTTFFAFNQQLAWIKWISVSKVLLMTFFTIILIDDRNKLRYLCLIISFSIGFYGIKGGIFSLHSAGMYRVWGPPDSFLYDNTAIGLAIGMILPFFYFLSKEERKTQLKIILIITFILSTLAIMFTYSRGALLGLAVVGFLLFLRLKLSRKVLAIPVLIILAIILIPRIPENWVDRVKTISQYKQDLSAISRITAWKNAWKVAKSLPLTGAGFQALEEENIKLLFETLGIQDERPPEMYSSDNHSIYFEVLSENGFITFGLFIILALFSIFSLRKLRKESGKVTSLKWQRNYSHMTEIGIITYLVSGAFLEFATFDLYYHLIAIVIILKSIKRRCVDISFINNDDQRIRYQVSSSSLLSSNRIPSSNLD